MSTVAIIKAGYGDCDRVIGKIFEMFPLEMEGKKVMIKPNALRSAAPEEGVTTHPAVVRAVVGEVARRNPASITVGDNPGVFGYGINEKVFRDTGLLEAAGGYYRNIGSDSVPIKLESRFISDISISREIIEADIYISVPKFKTHGLTGPTCAIKNSFGMLPGGLKARLHKAAGNPRDFAEVLVDIYAARIPDLVIVDGVLAMEGNGPASSDLLDLGLILAGYDGVAVDAVVSHMMGIDGLPRIVTLAGERGHGVYDLPKIQVIGELKPIPGFKLPERFLRGKDSGSPKIIWEDVVSVRPVVDRDLCNSCHTCVRHCPAGALAFDEGLVVDPDRCIVCFCCQEMCPQRAIELKRGVQQAGTPGE